MHYTNSSIFALYYTLDLRCQSTLQTNNPKQFEMEALYRWRAGQGRKRFAQGHWLNQRHSWKHYSWILAPGVGAHHHQLSSSHTPKQKPRAGKQQQGREVTCPSKPRVSAPTICSTAWKLGVQVRHLCILLPLNPQGSAANESKRLYADLGQLSFPSWAPRVHLSGSGKVSAWKEGGWWLTKTGICCPLGRF